VRKEEKENQKNQKKEKGAGGRCTFSRFIVIILMFAKWRYFQ